MKIDWGQLRTPQYLQAEADADQRARLRAARDAAIVRGITINGIGFSTDDLSQQRIMGAAVSAMLDPSYSVQWKTSAGFITLDAQTIIGAAQAVRAHVQACFDREAQILSDLESGIATSIEF